MTSVESGRAAQEPKVSYGNWVRSRRLVAIGAGVALLAFMAAFPTELPVSLRVGLAAASLVGIIVLFFPLYAYWQFSQRGGRFQERVYRVVIDGLGDDVAGSALDIGAGNGMLSIELARSRPRVEVLGIDSWGPSWEYSSEVCMRNARAAGVAERVRFARGDAAALDFPPGRFDAALSNLTFHEVRAVADKRAVVAEALRVVKPGGRFSFVDLFYDGSHYGGPGELERTLQAIELTSYELVPLGARMAVPLLLRHPRILGRAGVLHGVR